MAAAAAKTVCVTGGSGFIASWLIKDLLRRGYTVNATVRFPKDPKKIDHLVSLEGAKERLKLMKADLMEEGSFDAAIAGCEGVFHCASPFFLHDTPDPQAELIDPAVKGTLNVLGSAARTPSVRRAVLTSSEAAIAFNRTPRTADTVVDETWWSDPDHCKENEMWYVLSKTLAEKAAWDFVQLKSGGARFDLVSINPPCVIGPMMQPSLNQSCANVLSLINGGETYPNVAYGWVHVRDVVEAHILAFEKREANGRYYVAERSANPPQLINILAQLYPNLKFPKRCADKKPLAPAYKVNNERAKKLGVTITPLELALKETVESLKEKGFLKA
ncbi:hypothetical protein DM860_003922 [Cuscuta australis]|uniref:Dihydroflavonol 4-reductase n=1 Tax=Cuscuta australis TaxID=267555 RepID=A0A328CWP0_9ASTE|nr:hypothetical protein DM860_003922 [Cuscuta australis]